MQYNTANILIYCGLEKKNVYICNSLPEFRVYTKKIFVFYALEFRIYRLWLMHSIVEWK